MSRRKRSNYGALAKQLADANRRAKRQQERADHLQEQLERQDAVLTILKRRNGDLAESVHELKAKERYKS